MKVEIRIYHALTIFFVIVAVVYGVWTYNTDDGIEWVGLPALILTAGMSLMIGFYLEATARSIDDRPEDDPDGAVEDLPGEQGTFAPYSWWPLPLAASAALVFLGAAISPFVILYALPIGVWSLLGWVYEFYRGKHAH